MKKQPTSIFALTVSLVKTNQVHFFLLLNLCFSKTGYAPPETLTNVSVLHVPVMECLCFKKLLIAYCNSTFVSKGRVLTSCCYDYLVKPTLLPCLCFMSLVGLIVMLMLFSCSPVYFNHQIPHWKTPCLPLSYKTLVFLTSNTDLSNPA